MPTNNDRKIFQIKWGSNRTNNIDDAEAVRVSHNAILVSRMHLATIALVCKQTTDNFRTRNPPEPRWRHLSGNRILFVPHSKYLLFFKDGFKPTFVIIHVQMDPPYRGRFARWIRSLRTDEHTLSRAACTMDSLSAYRWYTLSRAVCTMDSLSVSRWTYLIEGGLHDGFALRVQVKIPYRWRFARWIRSSRTYGLTLSKAVCTIDSLSVYRCIPTLSRAACTMDSLSVYRWTYLIEGSLHDWIASRVQMYTYLIEGGLHDGFALRVQMNIPYRGRLVRWIRSQCRGQTWPRPAAGFWDPARAPVRWPPSVSGRRSAARPAHPPSSGISKKTKARVPFYK